MDRTAVLEQTLDEHIREHLIHVLAPRFKEQGMECFDDIMPPPPTPEGIPDWKWCNMWQSKITTLRGRLRSIGEYNLLLEVSKLKGKKPWDIEWDSSSSKFAIRVLLNDQLFKTSHQYIKVDGIEVHAEQTAKECVLSLLTAEGISRKFDADLLFGKLNIPDGSYSHNDRWRSLVTQKVRSYLRKVVKNPLHPLRVQAQNWTNRVSAIEGNIQESTHRY